MFNDVIDFHLSDPIIVVRYDLVEITWDFFLPIDDESGVIMSELWSHSMDFLISVKDAE
jgi:hypothetical protein